MRRMLTLTAARRYRTNLLMVVSYSVQSALGTDFCKLSDSHKHSENRLVALPLYLELTHYSNCLRHCMHMSLLRTI